MPETACLHIQGRDTDPIRVVELPGVSVRIGRAPYCEVRLAEPDLAEEECRLRRRGGTWQLVPMRPPGSVWFDGRSIEQPCPLPYDVPFRVGGSWLTLRPTRNAAPDWATYPTPLPLEPPPDSTPAPEHTGGDPPEDPAPDGDGQCESPRVDRPSLDHSPERLARWQARREQRESWLKAHQDDRRWRERWKAAGERLRARTVVPEPPRPSASPAATLAATSLTRHEGGPCGPDTRKRPNVRIRPAARRFAAPLTQGLADIEPPPISVTTALAVYQTPEPGNLVAELDLPATRGASFFADPPPIDRESPPEIARMDYERVPLDPANSDEALFATESSQAIAVEELPPSALGLEPVAPRTTPAPADPPRDRSKPSAGSWKPPIFPPRPEARVDRPATTRRLSVPLRERSVPFFSPPRPASFKAPAVPRPDVAVAPAEDAPLRDEAGQESALGTSGPELASDMSAEPTGAIALDREETRSALLPAEECHAESRDAESERSICPPLSQEEREPGSTSAPEQEIQAAGAAGTVTTSRQVSTSIGTDEATASWLATATAPEPLGFSIMPEAQAWRDQAPFVTDTLLVEPCVWTGPTPTFDSATIDLTTPHQDEPRTASSPRATTARGRGSTPRQASVTARSKVQPASAPTAPLAAGRPPVNSPSSKTAPPFASREWPSARDILAAHRVAPEPMVSAHPSVRRDAMLPIPTVAEAPGQWSLPLWLGWLPATAAALLVGAAGNGMAWTWSRDAYAAGQVANRLVRNARSPKPLPESITLQGTSWWKTTAGNLVSWALYQDRAPDAGPDNAEEVQSLLVAACQASPVQPAARLALSRPRQGNPERPLAARVGLSRDVIALAWSGHQWLKAGNREAAVRMYREALEMASRADLSRLAAPAFIEDSQVRRYALPYEDLIGMVVRDMAAQEEWTFEQWSEALPRFAVAPLVAARTLRERGAPDADRPLDVLLARAEATAPEGASTAVHLAAEGEALALKARWTEAERRYRQAIDLMPDEAIRRSWWMNLADIELRLNDEPRRLQALESARKPDSNDEITRRAQEFLKYSGTRPDVPEARAETDSKPANQP